MLPTRPWAVLAAIGACTCTARRGVAQATRVDGRGAFDSLDNRSSAQPEAPLPASTRRPICAQGAAGRRVVSVADLHGDFVSMAAHLKRLGIVRFKVDKRPHTWEGCWAGGNMIFVQTGDILDRGPDGRLMYKFLWKVQDEAAAADPAGEVVLLAGNHELMALQGDVRYVTNVDFCQYTRGGCAGRLPSKGEFCDDNCCTYSTGCKPGCMEGNCEFLKAWDKEGEMGKEFRKRFGQGKMKVAYIVSGVVFVHAGLVPTIWDKIGLRKGEDAVEKLNTLATEIFVNNRGKDLAGLDNVIVAGEGQNGPMWTRICRDAGYTSHVDDNELNLLERQHGLHSRCAVVAKSLQDVGAERIVIGHCPQGKKVGGNGMMSDGVEVRCSGTFLLTDTFMSVAYSGSLENSLHNMAALEFYSGDEAGRIWAVYAGRPRDKRCLQLEEPKPSHAAFSAPERPEPSHAAPSVPELPELPELSHTALPTPEMRSTHPRRLSLLPTHPQLDDSPVQTAPDVEDTSPASSPAEAAFSATEELPTPPQHPPPLESARPRRTKMSLAESPAWMAADIEETSPAGSLAQTAAAP